MKVILEGGITSPTPVYPITHNEVAIVYRRWFRKLRGDNHLEFKDNNTGISNICTRLRLDQASPWIK